MISACIGSILMDVTDAVYHTGAAEWQRSVRNLKDSLSSLRDHREKMPYSNRLADHMARMSGVIESVEVFLEGLYA